MRHARLSLSVLALASSGLAVGCVSEAPPPRVNPEYAGKKSEDIPWVYRTPSPHERAGWPVCMGEYKHAGQGHYEIVGCGAPRVFDCDADFADEPKSLTCAWSNTPRGKELRRRWQNTHVWTRDLWPKVVRVVLGRGYVEEGGITPADQEAHDVGVWHAKTRMQEPR